MRKWNFCAGPAVISEEVLEEVKSELLEYNNSGTSIMEVSHRSKLYSSVAAEAKQDLIDILNIPNVDGVLVGGASLNVKDFLAIYSAAVKHLDKF